MQNDTKTDTGAVPISTEQRQAREIEQLHDDLIRASRRIDDLLLERLTISKVIRRGKHDEQLQIIETHTTPQGVVIVVC